MLRATLDPQQQTLGTIIPAGMMGSAVTFETDGAVATFGNPDPFTVSLSGGALTFDEPLDLPAGPGGLTPPLSLTYSSAAVSEQHNSQGAASWVGEGWNLSMGAITWAESNTASGCTGSTCSATWANVWQLSDPFGTSAELIPPTATTSTYYDNSGNAITASPIFWQTAPATQAKVVSYTGSLLPPGFQWSVSIPQVAAPCFRVFLPNGIMEEFGCTLDSLQWYPAACTPPGGQGALYAPFIAAWYLDLITDRHGNQIHLTYQQDMNVWDSQVPPYPRDTVLSTIEYDSPTCQNSQVACTGSDWAPLMRLNFVASHAAARLTNTPLHSCNPDPAQRCDDPVDLTSFGGGNAPEVQHTFVLNDLQVQVRSSGSASWNTLRDYQFSYEQDGPTAVPDQVSWLDQSTAGMLDLTQLQEVGDDDATALPVHTFSYISLIENYEDSGYLVPGLVCTTTWAGRCSLHAFSFGGNSRYLASSSNGLGLTQTFTWAEAHNNTHGVVGSGSNTADPLYCNDHPGQSPCDLADDTAWSHAVLTQQTSAVLRETQNGQGGQQSQNTVTSTTSYSYQLTYPLPAEPCADCVAGMYWGNQNDTDYLDFYNYTFMGFAQATVIHPDGSVEVHHFYSTEGIGQDDPGNAGTCGAPPPYGYFCQVAPWWHLANVAHGHEYGVDSYDTDGTTLLKQTQTQYRLLCPGNGVSGTPQTPSGWYWAGELVSELDPANPVASCDIQPTQVDTYTYGGATTTTLYQASQGFSATQGQNQWRYQYSANGEQSITDMATYDSGNQRWKGTDQYCLVGSNWQHPALTSCDSIRTWVVPSAGSATISANGALSVAASCGGNVSGVNIRVLQNGSQVWPASGWQIFPTGRRFPSHRLRCQSERGITCNLW